MKTFYLFDMIVSRHRRKSRVEELGELYDMILELELENLSLKIRLDELKKEKNERTA